MIIVIINIINSIIKVRVAPDAQLAVLALAPGVELASEKWEVHVYMCVRVCVSFVDLHAKCAGDDRSPPSVGKAPRTMQEKWEVLLEIRLLWTTFLASIVKSAGCHCTDALGGKRNR